VTISFSRRTLLHGVSSFLFAVSSLYHGFDCTCVLVRGAILRPCVCVWGGGGGWRKRGRSTGILIILSFSFPLLAEMSAFFHVCLQLSFGHDPVIKTVLPVCVVMYTHIPILTLLYLHAFIFTDWLDDRIRFPVGVGNFSLRHRVQTGSGAHPASYPMGTRGSFPGAKATGA
jgi:hypothetical protein